MPNKNLNKLLKYYDHTAEKYDTMHSEIEHEIAIEFILKLIELYNIDSVLDIGAGTGSNLIKFKSTRKNLNVVGIEPSRALILKAKDKNIKNINLFMAVGENIPLKNNSFDAVCEFAMLHHVPDPDKVVSEMIRVAKNAIFISDSNRFGQGSILSRYLKLIIYKLRLWKLANYIKTFGKGYIYSEGDGISYSYSVYDSLNQIQDWADRVIIIPTSNINSKNWLHPLIGSSHLLLCAFKEN